MIEAYITVSIHAPMKGATMIIASPLYLIEVSIHAPVKGATRPVKRLRPVKHVSIHAPVKGATTSVSSSIWQHTRFNPRTREGCDLL